jgi:hypothetical protein
MRCEEGTLLVKTRQNLDILLVLRLVLIVKLPFLISPMGIYTPGFRLTYITSKLENHESIDLHCFPLVSRRVVFSPPRISGSRRQVA